MEFLTFLSVLRREIVSTTSDESMIDPSTIASGDKLLDAQALRDETPPSLLELDQFDRRAPDVQTHHAFFVREKSTLNSPKVQRSRLLTGAYLKLRCKLPGNKARVKRPCIYGYIVPVTELYTPVPTVARGIFSDSIGVCEPWQTFGEPQRPSREGHGERGKKGPWG